MYPWACNCMKTRACFLLGPVIVKIHHDTMSGRTVLCYVLSVPADEIIVS